MPPELVAGFSPGCSELVGYGVYSGLIGHIDKQSPGALLEASSVGEGGPGSGAPETKLIWDLV